MEAATSTIATPSPDHEPALGRACQAAEPARHHRSWAAAALPMGLLAWVVAPLLADPLSGSNRLSRALIVLLTAGLVWQFALVMFLVKREQGTLRLSVLRDALWLRAPRSPKTGLPWRPRVARPHPARFRVSPPRNSSRPFPLPRDATSVTSSSDGGQSMLAGAWGWFAVLGRALDLQHRARQEPLFRGNLLPSHERRVRQADWLANGVLFALYHVHRSVGHPSPRAPCPSSLQLKLAVGALRLRRRALRAERRAPSGSCSPRAQGLNHAWLHHTSNGPPNRRPVLCMKHAVRYPLRRAAGAGLGDLVVDRRGLAGDVGPVEAAARARRPRRRAGRAARRRSAAARPSAPSELGSRDAEAQADALVVGHDLAQAAGVGHDARAARGHRLERDEPERLVDRRAPRVRSAIR